MIKRIIITIFTALALMGGVSVATATATPSLPVASDMIRYATWTCPLCGNTYDIDPEDNLVEMHIMFAHPEWWKTHFGDGTDD